MSTTESMSDDRKMTSLFERDLTLWVGLGIVAGIVLGTLAPGMARFLDGLALDRLSQSRGQALRRSEGLRLQPHLRRGEHARGDRPHKIG